MEKSQLRFAQPSLLPVLVRGGTSQPTLARYTQRSMVVVLLLLPLVVVLLLLQGREEGLVADRDRQKVIPPPPHGGKVCAANFARKYFCTSLSPPCSTRVCTRYQRSHVAAANDVFGK